MKRRIFIYIPLSFFIILLLNFNLLSAESNAIPTWIKKIAKFWGDGITDDTEFVNALQYLIDKKIISVQDNVRAPHIVILTDKQQYKIGEPINITATNMGDEKALFGARPFIGITSKADGKPVCCFGREIETYLHPNSSSNYTWNQIGIESGTQVKTGWYGIHTVYSIPTEENYQNIYETKKFIEIVN